MTNDPCYLSGKHDLLQLVRLDHQPYPVTPGYLCSDT